MSADIYEFQMSADPGETIAVRAHIKNDAGTDYNQAGLSSISRKLVASDGGTVISTTTLTISSVVYDTLQTWPTNGDAPDDDGFNFIDRVTAPSDYGGLDVEYRTTFTDTSSRVSILRGLISVRAMP